jgi:hypothetical protein
MEMTMKTKCSIMAGVIVAVMVLSGCDSRATPTNTPMATPSATVCIGGGDCGTPALPPTATVTSTPTATPTATPMPIPTCQPQPAGSVILSCWLEANDDKLRNYGETGVSCTVVLMYDVGVQERVMWRIDSNTDGIWAGAMTPGVYSVLLIDYDQTTGGIPYYYADSWAYVNDGATTYINWPFSDYHYPLPTATKDPYVPTPVSTPTATPTSMIMHACFEYWRNCVDVAQACPANTVLDPLGSCGSGFKCCAPLAVTPVPSATPNSATKTKAAGG